MGLTLAFGRTGSVFGWGPWRLVEASGELGYEEALSRGWVYTEAVSCGETSQNESLFSN